MSMLFVGSMDFPLLPGSMACSPKPVPTASVPAGARERVIRIGTLKLRPRCPQSIPEILADNN